MKACNRKILELFYNAKHSGRITKPDAIGRVGEDSDGLVIEITWRVIDGIIEDAKFRAFGNPNAIAITSLMTDNIIGKSVEDAIIIGEDVIIDALDEFRPEYLEAFDMVRTAFGEAHSNYLKRQSRGEIGETNIERVREVEIEPVEQDSDEIVIRQIQTSIQSTTIVAVERRGRGRPRKERPEGEEIVVGEKRGRGRPRKIIDESEIVEVGEKRGRGRPRKIVDESEVIEEGEKRGRGRPRKERPEGEEIIVGEKRGRGRPRKERPEGEEIVVGEKRGRGRPRKIVDESEIVEVGEKRGRGRPRKIVDESEVMEVGEKRGRGRPKKEVKYNLPTDLDEVENDKELDELINGNSHQETTEFVDNLITNKLIDEDDDVFDADYDLFKSNIRNILSGKEVSNSNHYGESRTLSHQTEIKGTLYQDTQLEDEIVEEDKRVAQAEENETANEVATEKRGRGRPRKIVDESAIVEVGEKRGRGRPRKIVDESEMVEVGEKRGRGRPRKIEMETFEKASEPVRRVGAVNSLTRSLSTPAGMASFNRNQDIVFASKNVTVTNINVAKTTVSDNNQTLSNDYNSDVNYSSAQEDLTISSADVLEEVDEVEVEPVVELHKADAYNEFDDEDELEDEWEDEEDFDKDFDDKNIKDEAPKGGIEDLLKALLNDD